MVWKRLIYGCVFILMAIVVNLKEASGQRDDLALVKTDNVSNIYPKGQAFYKAEQYKRNGKYQAAIYWYQKAITRPDAPKSLIADALSQISFTYLRQGEYSASMEAYLKALQFSVNAIQKARIQVKGSNIYIDLFDYNRAHHLLDTAISVFKKAGDIVDIATGLGTKARVYRAQEQYHKAITSNIEAYTYLAEKEIRKTAKPSEQKYFLLSRNGLLNNIADNYLQLRKPDSALYYLKKVEPEFLQISKVAEATIYTSYAEAYALQGHYTEARKFFYKGLAIAEPGNMQTVKATAYKGLAGIYSGRHNYQKAFEYQKKYTELYKKQTSKEDKNKISQLQTQYALEKKDKEMAQMELQYNKRQLALQRRNNQLYLWIVSIGLSVLIIGILLRNQYNKNRFLKLQLKNAANEGLLNQVQASLRGEETERERIARELHDHVMSELMATQLNLKDIEHYHPELKASSRYENILIQMEETTELLRRTTHNMMPVGLKETGLATTIEAFLYRVSNHQLMISFQCFGEKKKLADSTEKILLSITHELVQNVVKHAHATEALVQLNYYSDSLSLTVEDNGVGMSKQDETSDEGLGWHNIRRNVAALSGTVDIQSSEQEGTTVLIEIPL